MSGSFAGVLLALLSAASFACSNVFISKSPVGSSDSRGVLVSIVFTLVISTLAWLTFEGGASGGEIDAEWLAGIAWYALAGLFAVVLGRRLLYGSIRRLGVTRASAVKRLNPFFSVILAVLLVGETLSGLDGAGMALVAAAFAILIHRSFAARNVPADGDPRPSDYAWGVGSALSYAMSYVLRKYGLAAIAAPAFGTMVSAAAGFGFFAAAALFIPARRREFLTMFRGVDRWMVAAGIFISVGQISLFAALYYEDISTVVMIASLETFVSAFLSVVVFRTEAKPEARTMIAAALATAGVITIAAG